MWLDYKQIRKRIRIDQLLVDAGMEVRGEGVQKKARCPLEDCQSKEGLSLSIHVTKGVWKCWQCHRRGNVIDLAAWMQNLDPQSPHDFRRAAQQLAQQYGMVSQQPMKTTAAHGPRRVAAVTKQPRQNVHVNAPLDFALKGLDDRHQSVRALGLAPSTVDHFGIGYCVRRGLLQGRLAIPIHDRQGRLVGYAGRRLVDAEQDSGSNPLYLYPERERVRREDGAVFIFDRSRLLYNAHRITSAAEHLVVVADPLHVWTLHEMGHVHVVAMLGPVCEQQTSLIAELVVPSGRVWFLTDAGEPVQSLVQVAKIRGVRWLMASNVHEVQSRVREVK